MIGRAYQDSTPWWPAPRQARAGAPNVVFVVLDDVGFADLGRYGSEIDTPVLDRLAAHGLRYTSFHTTAMCSQTRAALLTGRQPRAVGMGIIADWSAAEDAGQLVGAALGGVQAESGRAAAEEAWAEEGASGAHVIDPGVVIKPRAVAGAVEDDGLDSVWWTSTMRRAAWP
jgi:hypothetical protein